MEEKDNNMECPDCGAVVYFPDGCSELHCNCGAVLISEEQENAELQLAEELSRKWYYSHDKERFGPVPWKKIKNFVENNKLGPNNLIWSRGMEKWEKVSTFPELFECLPEESRQSLEFQNSSHEADKKADSEYEEAEPTGGVKNILQNSGKEAKDDLEPSIEHWGGKYSKGTGTQSGLPATLFLQFCAGLLTALAFANIVAIGITFYVSYHLGQILPSNAIWLILIFGIAAIIFFGISKFVRLACQCAKNIHEIKQKIIS